MSGLNAASLDTDDPMHNAAYLRYPSIRGDNIVFVTDDDVWQVSSAGGIARRLTAGLSEPSTPCESPDGKHIAFVSRDEQHAEVYLMPSGGGLARRMTWLGPDTMVRGWTPDGHILFVTTYGQPFFRNYRAYTLDPAGGIPKLIPYGQINHLALHPGGAKVIGRNTADPARWKRYKGGTAGHLWIDTEGNGQFRRMDELPGNITSPMWLGDRVFFLSDFEGVSNLYSCRPDGADRRRHTDHDAFYARHAQTDGARIVYQCGADIWLFDPTTDQAARLNVQVLSHRTQAVRRFVKAEDHMGTFRLHPAGHSVAVDVRGKMFSFALWEGAVRQWGERDGVRYRLGQWLPTARHLSRSATPRARNGSRSSTAMRRANWLGQRPRGGAAGSSQRSSLGHIESSQRSVCRRSRHRHTAARRSQRVRSH